jgi:hypothetical protein
MNLQYCTWAADFFKMKIVTQVNLSAVSTQDWDNHILFYSVGRQDVSNLISFVEVLLYILLFVYNL